MNAFPTDVLHIPRDLVDEMIAHARREAPDECWGLLAGVNDRVLGVFPCVNGAPPEERPFRYQTEPHSQRLADDAIGARGWQIWYEPAALVTHYRSQSASQNVMARDRIYHASKQRYVARYWGTTVGRALAATHALLFAAEAALQYRRGDRAQGRRYTALARSLLAGAWVGAPPPGAAL